MSSFLHISALRTDKIDSTWTIFLDRDGVINKRIVDGYVKSPDEFEFLPGALEAIRIISRKTPRVIIVTNQQGVAKGLMSSQEVDRVHDFLRKQVMETGGRIDGIYFCPEWAHQASNCRKPNSSMAVRAKQDFPEIDFSKSIMVGDMPSDIEFGKRLGMTTVWLQGDGQTKYSGDIKPDYFACSLWAVGDVLKR